MVSPLSPTRNQLLSPKSLSSQSSLQRSWFRSLSALGLQSIASMRNSVCISFLPKVIFLNGVRTIQKKVQILEHQKTKTKTKNHYLTHVHLSRLEFYYSLPNYMKFSNAPCFINFCLFSIQPHFIVNCVSSEGKQCNKQRNVCKLSP